MVQQKRRKPRKTARFLNMLLLVFAFLVVFEGRLIINIASKEIGRASCRERV